MKRFAIRTVVGMALFSMGAMVGSIGTAHLILCRGQGLGLQLVAAGVRLASASQEPIFQVSAGTALQVTEAPTVVATTKRRGK